MNPHLVLLAAAIHAYDHIFAMQTCPDCGATWQSTNPECWWCQRRQEAQRQELLRPTFIGNGDHCHAGDGTWLDHDANPATTGQHSALCGYDNLTDIDKAVWRRTRDSDEGSFTNWAQQLAHATTAGVITETEAKLALERAGKVIAAA